MRIHGILALGALVGLSGLASGCSNTRDAFRPVLTDAPFVYDIGELRVIDADEFAAAAPLDIPDALHFGQLGASENPGIYGGATFQFRGTGRDVCVVVDPEAMFWNKEISTQAGSVQYNYEDVFTDDGDLDLSVGLTAYYTGSPGTEIGDFNAVYDDPSGVEHNLAFNECVQAGYQGVTPVNAGRGTVEYCDIDTSLREGILYTAVLETFALPIDDSKLAFGTMAFDGPCAELPWVDANGANQAGPAECVIPNEVGNADPNGLAEDKAWFPELEAALCTGKGKVNTFCKDNPDAGCQPLDE
ncbi:MAG: hypothetical protein Q8P18_19105 [Pseudomonadota bacterium]|nr:hypothetical protein [Pseudomonadota bacterium]